MEGLFTECLTGIAAFQVDFVVWLKWLIGIGLFIAGAAYISGFMRGDKNA